MSTPLLELRGVAKRFGTLRRPIWALAGIDLRVGAGETLGIVGESGSGKSPAARIAVGLDRPTRGEALLEGRPVTTGGRVQMVFQDPAGSLDPLLRIGPSVREPLDARRGATAEARRGRTAEALAEVGLDGDFAMRFPAALSGGQKQRASIARALAALPPLIVCDEAVTALDVSIRAQILNLLRRVQDAHGTACLFISHDLCTVAHMSHRIAVMYLGKVVEEGTTAQILARPAHPYPFALLSAVPQLQQGRLRRARLRLQGDPPSVMRPPPGCRFQTRCPMADGRCRTEEPPMRELEQGHRAACHHAPVEEGRLVAAAGGRVA
jgi:oligopeptide/dipeptide ABC transporter ATP-binding protein